MENFIKIYKKKEEKIKVRKYDLKKTKQQTNYTQFLRLTMFVINYKYGKITTQKNKNNYEVVKTWFSLYYCTIIASNHTGSFVPQ